jgi:hypothetical protein
VVELIEPDRQISRIRLSEKTVKPSPAAHRAQARLGVRAEVPIKVREWKGPALASSDLVLDAQPPAQRANWTLVNRVCKACNNRFSRFETELLQQASESLARRFSGPLGRSARGAGGKRIQPLKINHLYLLNANPLVYEAGFWFPSEFYVRAKMIDANDGTLSTVIANKECDSSMWVALTVSCRPARVIVSWPPELWRWGLNSRFSQALPD